MYEHHLGIVVENIEESKRIFAHLGYKVCSEVVMDDYQHNRILFLENLWNSRRIELIQAMDDYSTVKNFKPGFHHICYEVENKDDFDNEFREMKVGKIFSKEFIAPAIEDRRVVFACLKNGLFVEFLLGDVADE